MTTRTSNKLLGLLIIQNTAASLIARHVSADYNYDVVRLLFIAENLKLVLSISLEAYTISTQSTQSSSSNPSNLCQSLHKHVWLNPLDALKLSIPALLYLLQSIFGFIAIKMIPVPLFLIMQQTKLVKTTLLSIVMLKRSYSLTQWISIISLCVGSSLTFMSVIGHEEETMTSNPVDAREDQEQIMMDDNITNEQDDDDVFVLAFQMMNNFRLTSNMIGIILVLASNLCSSLAGVYFELVIKGVDRNNNFNEKGNEKDFVVQAKKNNDEEYYVEMKSLLDNENKENCNSGVTNKHECKKRRKSATIMDKELQDIKSNAIQDGKMDDESLEKGCDIDQNEINKETFDIRSNQPSIWMRNIQLSFFQICILLANILANLGDESEKTPILGEFHLAVWAQIVLFAFGSMLVAAVIQKADNVQRGICMALSVILTSAVSIVMDKSNSLSITFQFVLGAFLAITGCFFFANPTLVFFNNVIKTST